jgi:hypothetical protein
MQKFGHKYFNLGKSIFSIYATINLCVDDLDGVEEGESGEHLDGGAGGRAAWTWRWLRRWLVSRQRGSNDGGCGTASRTMRRRSGCAVWTRQRLGRRSMRRRHGPGGSWGGDRRGAGVDPTTVEAWWQSRSGHVGDGEKMPSRLGFKGGSHPIKKKNSNNGHH